MDLLKAHVKDSCHKRRDCTDDIIIIRATDPDGKVFQRILDILDTSTKEVIDMTNGKDYELSFPGLTIKITAGVVLCDGQPVKLNYGEFSMLCHLAKHPNYIFSKEQLYAAVYGENHFNSNTVPSTICRLRSKIEPDPRHPIYVKTVIGLGYKFESPEK